MFEVIVELGQRSDRYEEEAELLRRRSRGLERRYRDLEAQNVRSWDRVREGEQRIAVLEGLLARARQEAERRKFFPIFPFFPSFPHPYHSGSDHFSQSRFSITFPYHFSPINFFSITCFTSSSGFVQGANFFLALDAATHVCSRRRTPAARPAQRAVRPVAGPIPAAGVARRRGRVEVVMIVVLSGLDDC